jgi:hypothetical protein
MSLKVTITDANGIQTPLNVRSLIIEESKIAPTAAPLMFQQQQPPPMFQQQQNAEQFAPVYNNSTLQVPNQLNSQQPPQQYGQPPMYPQQEGQPPPMFQNGQINVKQTQQQSNQENPYGGSKKRRNKRKKRTRKQRRSRKRSSKR